MCNDEIVRLVGRIAQWGWWCRNKSIDASIGSTANDEITCVLVDSILKKDLMVGSNAGDFTTSEPTGNAILINLIYINCIIKDVSDVVLDFATVAGFSIGVELKTVSLCLKTSPVIKFIPIEIEVVGASRGFVGIQCLNAHKIHLIVMYASMWDTPDCDLRNLALPLHNPTDRESVERDSCSVKCVPSAGSTLKFKT